MLKNILIVGNYPPPFGGVPRHLEYLVPALSKRGWNVHVLSSGRTGRETIGNINIYKLPILSKLFIFLKFLLFEETIKRPKAKSLKKNFGDSIFLAIGCKIVKENNIQLISSYNFSSNGPVGASLAKHFGIKHVLTNFGEFYSNSQFFNHNKSLVNHILENTDKFLAMSNHCASGYKKIGLNPKVEVIRYGVMPNEFNPASDRLDIRKNNQISSSDIVVMFCGRITKDMGIYLFLNAITKILLVNKNLKFIIVGARGPAHNNVLAFCKEYSNNVFYFNDVPFKNLQDYYFASDILVVPTLGERACGSLAAIEAMSCKRAVIGSNIGGIPEIISDNRSGLLFDIDDDEDLMSKILLLSKNKGLIKKFGYYGREIVEQNFDEQAADSKIIDIFEKLIE